VKLDHAKDWMEDGDRLGDMNEDWKNGLNFMSADDKKKRWKRHSGIHIDPSRHKVQVVEWAFMGKAGWEAHGAGTCARSKRKRKQCSGDLMEVHTSEG